MKAKILIYTVLVVLLTGCKEGRENKSAYSEVAVDATSIDKDSTAVAKIIKTADMRFRVKNVLTAKEELAATVKTWGGTVIETATNSYVERTEKVKYSADSLKEITSYNTQGVMVAKVPSEKLDDFTNTVAKIALFVDNQSLKLDDQSINYLQNRLKAKNRLDALGKLNKQATKKGTDVETGLYIKDNLIEDQIDNMRIDDKVKFSTITLNFYQGNTVKTFLVGNDKVADYRPGFFRRLGLNLVDGWGFFKEFMLAMANVWVFIVLIFGAFFTYRYFRRRKSNQL